MPVRKRIESKSSVTPAAPSVQAPDPAAVAARAYFLFLERGGSHGHDWDDWLQAERDLAAMSAESTSGLAADAAPRPKRTRAPRPAAGK
jgi:hypothetical protein